jgi:hypothetical protein
MERLSSAQLIRLVCRGAEWLAQTAEDAVLTRTLPNLSELTSGLSVYGSPNLVHGLIDEAAEPDIHYQADRHEHKQSGRAAVAHERQRNAGHRHSADDHGHIHENVET